MKKLITIILILALVPVIALADLPDISALSWDELVELQESITLQMMQMSEFKSVTVPEGVYQVGKEIPAGSWDILAVLDDETSITYFEKIDEYGLKPLKDDGYYWYDISMNIPGYKVNSIHLDLVEGMYIKIGMCSAVFTKHTGPGFSFD